jgi:hypothetical protein
MILTLWPLLENIPCQEAVISEFAVVSARMLGLLRKRRSVIFPRRRKCLSRFHQDRLSPGQSHAR